jgi:transcriptional regulator with XRE-family HTH domain
MHWSQPLSSGLRGESSQATADRAGLDIRHFQKVEHEDSNATLATLARIAAALDVGIAALFSAPRPRSH